MIFLIGIRGFILFVLLVICSMFLVTQCRILAIGFGLTEDLFMRLLICTCFYEVCRGWLNFLFGFYYMVWKLFWVS